VWIHESEGKPMHTESEEFLEEQKQGLKKLVGDFRKARMDAARKAALESAVRIKAMNVHVRQLARSGVRLTSISQGTAERLIELQSEIVTSALDDAAVQLQRIADTEHVGDLARGQTEVLQATRQRIVGDISRAMKILKSAAGDVREVATRARKAAAAPRKMPARRASKRAVARPAKVATAARKTRGRARVKQAGRSRRPR
jgi:phasin family protein